MLFSGVGRADSKRYPHLRFFLVGIPLLWLALCSCHKNRSEPSPLPPVSDAFNSVTVDQRSTAQAEQSTPPNPPKIQPDDSSQVAPPAPSSTINVSTGQPAQAKQNHHEQCPSRPVTVVCPSSQCPACPSPPKPCDETKAKAQLEILLARASLERDLGHWDKAADLYAQAMQSCAAPALSSPSSSNLDIPAMPVYSSASAWGHNWRDWICIFNWPIWHRISPRRWDWQLIRDWVMPWRWCQPAGQLRAGADARENFRYAQTQLHTWWWNWGTYFPPLRWCHAHSKRFHWVMAVALLLFISPVFLGGRGLLNRGVNGMGWLFRPRFRGRAVVVAPVKLTENAEIGAFAQSLTAAATELRRLLTDPDLGAKPVTMLALPSALSGDLQEVPTIKSLNLGSIVKFMVTVARFFGWRLESQLAFSPALKAESDRPAVPPRMRVFASIRWGWYVWRSLELEREVWDQYDVDALALAVVARTVDRRTLWRAVSLAVARTVEDKDRQRRLMTAAPGFTDYDSFGFFIEGLRALQCYGEESDRGQPRRPLLDWFINQAVARLRQGVEGYPQDILSQYYLGIALTTLNQHIYVERLCDLSTSFVAFGRCLGLLDLHHLPDQAPHPNPEAETARQESLEARELDQEPWQLLREAELRFKQILKALDVVRFSEEAGAALRRTTTYNLAEIYSRLGRRANIHEAITRLADMEIGNPTRPEQHAFNLQVQTMRLSLIARRSIEVAHSPAAAIDLLRAHAARIEQWAAQAGTDTRLASDVQADYWTKLGYVRLELALHPAARPNRSCDEVLKEAEDSLRQRALIFKANWNPAQIYLALSYRIHSGAAQAMGDQGASNRYSRKANSLFAALRGVPLGEPKPEPPTWAVTGSVRGRGAHPQGPRNWRMDVEGSLHPKKGEPQP